MPCPQGARGAGREVSVAVVDAEVGVGVRLVSRGWLETTSARRDRVSEGL